MAKKAKIDWVAYGKDAQGRIRKMKAASLKKYESGFEAVPKAITPKGRRRYRYTPGEKSHAKALELTRDAQIRKKTERQPKATPAADMAEVDATVGSRTGTRKHGKPPINKDINFDEMFTAKNAIESKYGGKLEMVGRAWDYTQRDPVSRKPTDTSAAAKAFRAKRPWENPEYASSRLLRDASREGEGSAVMAELEARRMLPAKQSAGMQTFETQKTDKQLFQRGLGFLMSSDKKVTAAEAPTLRKPQVPEKMADILTRVGQPSLEDQARGRDYRQYLRTAKVPGTEHTPATLKEQFKGLNNWSDYYAFNDQMKALKSRTAAAGDTKMAETLGLLHERDFAELSDEQRLRFVNADRVNLPPLQKAPTEFVSKRGREIGSYLDRVQSQADALAANPEGLLDFLPGEEGTRKGLRDMSGLEVGQRRAVMRAALQNEDVASMLPAEARTALTNELKTEASGFAPGELQAYDIRGRLLEGFGSEEKVIQFLRNASEADLREAGFPGMSGADVLRVVNFHEGQAKRAIKTGREPGMQSFTTKAASFANRMPNQPTLGSIANTVVNSKAKAQERKVRAAVARAERERVDAEGGLYTGFEEEKRADMVSAKRRYGRGAYIDERATTGRLPDVVEVAKEQFPRNQPNWLPTEPQVPVMTRTARKTAGLSTATRLEEAGLKRLKGFKGRKGGGSAAMALTLLASLAGSAIGGE